MKILWTDGSASPNPGPGGYAVIEEIGEEYKPVVVILLGQPVNEP